MGTLKAVFGILKDAAADWSEDNAPRLGAALSYYTVFSLAPLLLITIAIAGLAFGQEAARAASSTDRRRVRDGRAKRCRQSSARASTATSARLSARRRHPGVRTASGAFDELQTP